MSRHAKYSVAVVVFLVTFGLSVSSEAQYYYGPDSRHAVTFTIFNTDPAQCAAQEVSFRWPSGYPYSGGSNVLTPQAYITNIHVWCPESSIPLNLRLFGTDNSDSVAGPVRTLLGGKVPLPKNPRTYFIITPGVPFRYDFVGGLPVGEKMELDICPKEPGGLFPACEVSIIFDMPYYYLNGG